MIEEERLLTPNGISPFEGIRRANAAGAEFWSSRDFAQVLAYSDYRNFEQVIKKAKTACFNSGHRIESGAIPESLPLAENIKKLESGRRKRWRALESPPSEWNATGDSPQEGGM